LRRQASEQYFTSAQFFAHRRRQVMVRPQLTQGLLGSAALLPLKLSLLFAMSQCYEFPGRFEVNIEANSVAVAL